MPGTSVRQPAQGVGYAPEEIQSARSATLWREASSVVDSLLSRFKIQYVCVCACVCVLRSLRGITQCHAYLSQVRAVTEGSKYFELGWQPHELFNSKYLLLLTLFISTSITVTPHHIIHCQRYLSKCMSAPAVIIPAEGSCMLPKHWKQLSIG